MGKTNMNDEYCGSNTRTPAFGVTWYFDEALTGGRGGEREGERHQPNLKVQRFSSTTSTTASAFPFSFKILDILYPLTRKALVKSTGRESMSFEKKHLWISVILF